MTIRIERIGGLYMARVTPPHGSGLFWRSERPVDARELVDQLLARGCHQTDIGDAFYEADPEWVSRLEQPERDA